MNQRYDDIITITIITKQIYNFAGICFFFNDNFMCPKFFDYKASLYCSVILSIVIIIVFLFKSKLAYSTFVANTKKILSRQSKFQVKYPIKYYYIARLHIYLCHMSYLCHIVEIEGPCSGTKYCFVQLEKSVSG